MECNHIYNFSDIGIFCEKCFKTFAVELDGVNYWIISDEQTKKEIQNEFSMAKYSDWEDYLKIRSSNQQHVIINNQINKITDLETEVKRLEKIVIGLSERLINNKEVI